MKFKETQLRLGLLYIFGCKPSKGAGRKTAGVRNSKRAERLVRCAAYDF
jgi:hypothetical protein